LARQAAAKHNACLDKHGVLAKLINTQVRICRSRYFSLDYQDQEVKGARLEDIGSGRRIGRIELPVEKAEPLVRENRAFLAACRGEESLYVSGVEGRRALETALRVVDAIH
jgi:hypothetical protein